MLLLRALRLCAILSLNWFIFAYNPAGLKTLGPAVQYLAGEMAVEAGMVLPLRAAHNTVRLRFDVEEAEYLNLTKADTSFPPRQFAMLADARRNEVRATLQPP